MGFNIAIDGPAGAGKSTIAKLLAENLGFIYVDTGAMYRAIAVYLIDQGISSKQEKEIRAQCTNAKVSIEYNDKVQQVLLNHVLINDRLRQEEVGTMASVISVYPEVRNHLLSLQQNLAANCDCIMDGRDIGTCVLPKAQLKIYLTASVETRASRRYKELLEKGERPDLERIREQIIQRDQRDMNRDIAPLKQAGDAVLIDSSNLTILQVVDQMMILYQERRETK